MRHSRYDAWKAQAERVGSMLEWAPAAVALVESSELPGGPESITVTSEMRANAIASSGRLPKQSGTMQ